MADLHGTAESQGDLVGVRRCGVGGIDDRTDRDIGVGLQQITPELLDSDRTVDAADHAVAGRQRLVGQVDVEHHRRTARRQLSRTQ
jgi:hypothetical protein